MKTKRNKRHPGHSIERPPVTFDIRTESVRDMGLVGLHEPIGTARGTVPGIGEVEVEVCRLFPGAIGVIVNVDSNDKKLWRAYVFSVEDIARAAIEKVRAFPIRETL